MPSGDRLKIRTLAELYGRLPDEERMITDILRQILIEHLPQDCKEKISFNVPFFYRNRGICIIWPASIPEGGFKSGVLLGFWHGNKINDTQRYLTRGNNKQVFYKIYENAEDIKPEALKILLKEAIRTDNSFEIRKTK